MSASKFLLLPVSIFALAQLAQPAVAAEKKVKINNTEYKAAEVSLDRQLRLKKLFLFPTLDDISGVLAPQLDARLQDALSRNTRFEIVKDSGVAKALNSDSGSYQKVAQNESVHSEAAKVAGADATVMLRTRSIGGTIEMNLDWRDASGRLIYTESAALPGFSTMDARGAVISGLVKTIVDKIPFRGTVTGRTSKTLTVDLGKSEIAPGDEIEVARLISAQRHPLLGTIVSVDYVTVGKAKITNVDKALSFAEVEEEASGESIAVENKIIRIKKNKEPAAALEPQKHDDKFKVRQNDRDVMPPLESEFDRPRARYGMAALELGYGSISHNHTSNGVTTDVSGAGIGGAIDGELWITREWILGAAYAAQSSTLTGTAQPAGTAIETGTTAWRVANIWGGYRLIPGGRVEGTVITMGVGYQSIKITMPADSTNGFGNRKYSGLLARVAGEISLNPTNKVSVAVGFQPFAGLVEEGFSGGTVDGSTAIAFNLFWNHLVWPNLWVRLGFSYISANGSYLNAGSVADKKFAFGPGIVYSF